MAEVGTEASGTEASGTEASGTESTTIDVKDDASVHAWAKKLDATPEQIREAVDAKGSQAADVEMHLKGSHATTNADQEARADTTDPR